MPKLVQNDASVDAAFKTLFQKTGGRLDIIVNNAGLMIQGISEAITAEQTHQMFDVNVLGIQRVLRAALPQLRKNKSGLIINVGSILGRVTIPFMGLRPVSTKEGGGVSLYAMTQALGHEPKLLEIIEIPFSEAAPLPFQPENWLIEKPEKGSWKSKGVFPLEKTALLVDENPEFWHDPQGSARKVKEGWPQKMKKTASLYLIKPDKIHSVAVWTQRNTYPGAEKPSQRRRVISATHQGHLHEFDIDDPKFAEKYYPKFPGLGDPKWGGGIRIEHL